jgi:hypothetical protein
MSDQISMSDREVLRSLRGALNSVTITKPETCMQLAEDQAKCYISVDAGGVEASGSGDRHTQKSRNVAVLECFSAESCNEETLEASQFSLFR